MLLTSNNYIHKKNHLCVLRLDLKRSTYGQPYMFDEDNNKNALLISADSNIRRKDSNAIKSFQKLFPQATLKSFCEIIGGIFSTSIYFSASD